VITVNELPELTPQFKICSFPIKGAGPDYVNPLELSSQAVHTDDYDV